MLRIEDRKNLPANTLHRRCKDFKEEKFGILKPFDE